MYQDYHTPRTGTPESMHGEGYRGHNDQGYPNHAAPITPPGMYNYPTRQSADPLVAYNAEMQPMLPYHEYDYPPHPADFIKPMGSFRGDYYYEDEIYCDKTEDYYDDEEAMEEFLEPALTQDVYALLYTADLRSVAFLFAFMTMGLQFNLLWLLFFNLYDTDLQDPNTTNEIVNRLRLPAGVEYTVTFAQFLALYLTVILMANEGDAVQGISQLLEGYEPDIQKASPNATFFRWLVSGVLQTSNGLMFVVLSFILTMQSTDVISLFLNLTGLIFLQEIDDWGFQIASSGLLGFKTQKACEHVMGIKQLVPEDMKKRILYSKRAFVGVLLVSVLVPYVILAWHQADGKYLCSTVYVQMGDSYFPQFAYYSGKFERAPWQFLVDYNDRRPNYVDPTGTLELSWCRAEEAWTISYTNSSSCDYIFKSSTTQSFDVTEAEGGVWYVKTDRTGDYPVDWIKLLCNDCINNEERCNGECIDNKCVNNEPGWRGLNFEFPPATCDFFSSDQTTTAALSAISGASFFLSNSFIPLPPESNATMNDRLIYTAASNAGSANISEDAPRTFLLFSGRRWIIYGLPQGIETTLTYNELVQFMQETSSQNTVSTLKNISSNSLFRSYRPMFFSSPVDYGTDSYSVEPSAVTWLRAEEEPSEPILGYKVDTTKPVDVKLHCAACNDETNPCENSGICQDGSCLCPQFFSGFMCEYAIGCAEVGSACFFGHKCDPFSNICICDHGYYGNLCQYGPDVPDDPFYCESFSCAEGHCNCTFAKATGAPSVGNETISEAQSTISAATAAPSVANETTNEAKSTVSKTLVPMLPSTVGPVTVGDNVETDTTTAQLTDEMASLAASNSLKIGTAVAQITSAPITSFSPTTWIPSLSPPLANLPPVSTSSVTTAPFLTQPPATVPPISDPPITSAPTTTQPPTTAKPITLAPTTTLPITSAPSLHQLQTTKPTITSAQIATQPPVTVPPITADLFEPLFPASTLPTTSAPVAAQQPTTMPPI